MKKNLIVILILSLLFGLVVFADSDAIGQLEDQLDEMGEKLNTLNDSHNSLDNEKNSIVRNIKALNNSVQSTENEIVNLNTQIGENEVQVNFATLELDGAIQVLNETNDLLDSRIRVMYMNGTVGYFEVLLESKNFEDLLVRIDMLKRIVKSDTNLIDQMETDKLNVIEKKTALESEQEKLFNLHAEMEVKKAELEVKITEYEVAKKAVEKDIVAVAIQIDEVKEDADKVTEYIADLKLQALYAGGKMLWPVPNNKRLSSEFGMRMHPILGINKMHTGIDIPCATGTPVVAAQSGTVIWSNWLSSYGKAIMIDHGGGIVTLYAHNSSLEVRKGSKVTQGQTIALAGNTGNSTGSHVHFEVREDGEYVDPMLDWLKMASEF